MISQLITLLKNGCLTCLTYLIMIPCLFCCMLLTSLIPSYEDGREAASSILGYQFDGELTEIEFIDEPPIALFPGGASERSSWVVLELGETEAKKFEQMVQTSSEWQEMPLSEELNAYNDFAKSYSNQNEVSFIYITDITRQGLNNPELVASDGLHPSKLAYSKFVELLRPVAMEKLE